MGFCLSHTRQRSRSPDENGVETVLKTPHFEKAMVEHESCARVNTIFFRTEHNRVWTGRTDFQKRLRHQFDCFTVENSGKSLFRVKLINVDWRRKRYENIYVDSFQLCYVFG